MAAKIFLTLLAAFCAAQVATAALSSQQKQLLKWAPSDFAKFIEEAIEKVESIVNSIDKEVEDSILNVVTDIDEIIDALAKLWKKEVEKWVKKAEDAGVDIEDCLEKEAAVIDLVSVFEKDAEKCVIDRVDDVKIAYENATNVAAEILVDVNTTLTVLEACIAKKNILKISVCLLEDLPIDAAAIAGSAIKFEVLAGYVIEKVVEVGPLASLCIAEVVANVTTQVQEDAEAAVSCIMNKVF